MAEASKRKKRNRQRTQSSEFLHLEYTNKSTQSNDMELKTELQLLKEQFAAFVESSESELNDLKSTIEDQSLEIESLKLDNNDVRSRLQVAEGRVERLEKEQIDVTNDLVSLQDRSMRDNLLFFKINEVKDETATQTRGILNEFLKTKLKIETPIGIDRVHRIGQQRDDLYPRAIVAKFNPYSGKELIMSKVHHLKGTGMFISEQHPKPIQEKKRYMQETRKALSTSNPNTRCTIVKDKMYLNGRQAFPIPVPVSDSDIVQDTLDSKVRNGPMVQSTVGVKYQVHIADVDNVSKVKPILLKSYMDPFVAKATSNSYAYAIKQGSEVYYDFEDDGNVGMGRTIRQLLAEKDLTNVLVSISTWNNGKFDSEKWKVVKKMISEKLDVN